MSSDTRVMIQNRPIRVTVSGAQGRAGTNGGGGGGGTGIALAIIYHTPQDQSASDIAMGGPFPLPAGQLVGFDNQADSDENGYAPADGAGGVDLGEFVAWSTLDPGTVVGANVAFYDYDNLPDVWSPVAAVVPHIEPQDLPTLFPGESLAVTFAGGPTTLTPTNGPYAWLTGMQFHWGQDILDDSSTISEPFQAWVQPLLYVADTDGGDRYFQMGPHATLIRYTLLHNDGSGTLHVSNLPGDGIDFSMTLGPGQRCMVWPNQAKWETWALPPQFAAGDEEKVIAWDTDGNLTSTEAGSTGGSVIYVNAALSPFDIGLQTMIVVDTTDGPVTLTLPGDRQRQVLVYWTAGSNGLTILNPDTSTNAELVAGVSPLWWLLPTAVGWDVELALTVVDGETGAVDLSDNYDAIGTASTLMDGHVADTDPHGDRAYADSLLAANDAMRYRGTIAATANPNYPAADAGDTYRISAAGKIGGGSGVNVEVGDMIICLTDSSSVGNQAAVGANWNVLQVNLDGAVIGPASATNNNIAVMSGTTGKLIADGGATIANLVPTTRTLAGLDLSADRTAAALKTALAITESDVTNLTTDLAAKAATTDYRLAGSPYIAAGGLTGSMGMPGMSAIQGNTSLAMVADTLYYEPFVAPFDMSVTALYAYVATGVAATNVRIALVPISKSTFLPTAAPLAESSSTASTSSNTLITHTPGSPVALSKGSAYALLIQSDGAPTMRALAYLPDPFMAAYWGIGGGGDRLIYMPRVARSYAAIGASTPASWDTVTNASAATPAWRRVAMRWTV